MVVLPEGAPWRVRALRRGALFLLSLNAASFQTPPFFTIMQS